MAGNQPESSVVFWRKAAVCAAVTVVLGMMPATASSDSATPPDPASSVKPAATQPVEVLDPRISAEVASAVVGQSYHLSDIKGDPFASHPFQDICRDGVLIGFRLGLGSSMNTQMIKYIQPIYLTPRGEERGKGFGDKKGVEHSVEAKAPNGYAVGAVNIYGGGLSGMTITYMRFNGTRIDPTDTRSTPKVGGGGNYAEPLDGDGTPIIGIHGHLNDKGDSLGLGFVFIKPTAMVDHH